MITSSSTSRLKRNFMDLHPRQRPPRCCFRCLDYGRQDFLLGVIHYRSRTKRDESPTIAIWNLGENCTRSTDRRWERSLHCNNTHAHTLAHKLTTPPHSLTLPRRPKMSNTIFLRIWTLETNKMMSGQQTGQGIMSLDPDFVQGSLATGTENVLLDEMKNN